MKKTITRKKLVKYLDEFMGIAAVQDDSLNGLQVEGSSRVGKISFAVDACQETVESAARADADMLIVHHGLLWGKTKRITGVMQKRLSVLLGRSISLYAVHLPLDLHEKVGNNVELARLLGFKIRNKFARYKGTEIGYTASPPKPVSRSLVVKKLESLLEANASILPFGPKEIKTAGIVSGGGSFFAAEAKDLGCDSLITGETSHVGYHIAKECEMNMIFAGHYASETVGLKALAGHLKKEFKLECSFISAPTGF